MATKKTYTVNQLKKKAWKLVSEYVRRSNADWKGDVRCVTCQKTMPWKEAQAGHFIQGRRNAVVFDLRHIYPQCMPCNVFRHGNLIAYYPFMIKQVGEEVIEELKELNKHDKQFTRTELEVLIESLKEKIKNFDERCRTATPT